MDCVVPVVASAVMLIIGWAIVGLTVSKIQGQGAGLAFLLWIVSVVSMSVLTVVFAVSLYTGAC